MKRFDVQRIPLEGTRLIEAAAGTGKTYSIEQLCLRLLFEKRIPIEQILVLTFTQAATAELRERIYQRLLDSRTRLARGAAGLPSLPLPPELAPQQAAVLVRNALMDFDQAPITTIHGFCQRILNAHAFEAGSAFDCRLLPDPGRLVQDVADDFWRRQISDAPAELIAVALRELREPACFRELFEKVKSPAICIRPREDAATLAHLASYRDALVHLRDLWPRQGREALERLRAAPLNGTVYGSLKPDASGGPGTRRDAVLDALGTVVEDFLSSPEADFPPPAAIERLSSEQLAARTHKGRSAPSHAVFDACSRVQAEAAALEGEIARRLRALKAAFLDFARSELAARKRRQNVQSFDDLLLQVDAALSSPHAAALVESVRGSYAAVLVDEFQDTDDLQVAILSRLFAGEERILFLIGDPKQAIYGFRGADIFSYLKAAAAADSVSTLIANRRSTPGLVAAVNTLFSESPHPFLFPQIEFHPARCASAETPAASAPPFVVWYLDSRDLRTDGKPALKPDAEARVAAAVAAEIQTLTADGIAPLAAGEIAVLVRTNRQARLVKQHLSGAGLPSVVCSAGSVFDSPEAEALERLLRSIAAPADIGRLRAALATEIMGVEAGGLLAADTDDSPWQERFARTLEYARLWERDGFMPMFRRLLSAEGVKQRLLALIDGERRVTNLLHLAEILHQAASERRLSMNDLLQWLADQRDPATPRREEHQLRLESDEHAVKIVTIHKSKGLEYRVVFCPFAWSGSELRAAETIYHDPSEGYRLTLDLSGDPQSPGRRMAQWEALSENLRLLYVALTRARQRCYLAWGRINRTETSAPAYLFHGRRALPAGGDAPAAALEELTGQMRAMDDEEMLADLDRIAARSGGTVAVRPLPDAGRSRARSRPPHGGRLFGRRFCGSIDRSHGTASYSTLAAGPGVDPDSRDRDTLFFMPMPAAEVPAADGLFAFPRGSSAGSFFHALLEKADFSDPADRANDALIRRTLVDFGYEERWVDALGAMIGHVASVPLFADSPGLCLSQVRPEERLHELEFIHPLKFISPERLHNVFAQLDSPAGGAALAARLAQLSFAPVEGYMKGFIDLVFRHGSRYYLLDWKSNHLGNTFEDYRPERLAETMRDELYVLQYHIYCLALDRYLRLRQPDYRYERDFGGLAYVFIRGINRDLGADCGVFCDKPDPAFMRLLDEALIGEG